MNFLLASISILALPAILGLTFLLRPKPGPPTRSERIAALSWLIIRRSVCFLFGAMLVGGAIYNLISFLRGQAPLITLLWIAVGLLISIPVFLVGVFGISGRYSSYPYTWTDTGMLHDRRKKRYGWRW